MTERRNRQGSRRPWRWAVGAVAAGVLTAVLPASPAAAASENVFVRLYSGEGLDAQDDFNDVSTDDGTTWIDATVVAAEPGWATIPNTEWISSDSAKGTGRENATTVFRRHLRLPPGVTGSTGQICIHADDAVTVTYNGSTVVEQPAGDVDNASGAPSCGSVAGLATSGTNTLLFTVPNGTGALGIDFELIMTYTKDLDAAPELLLSDIETAATVPSGATVQFSVSAIDVTGMTIPDVPCDPPSNTFFPVGDTTVTCTATGSNGRTSTGTFLVTVTPFPVANEHPVLTLPADIRLTANSTSGRTVTYSTTATDDGATPPVITCVPPSGSRFRVGATNVTCTATDDQQLSSSGSFTVTIVGPLEQACAKLQEALGLTSKSRLMTVLNAAADHLHQAARGTDSTTIRSLAQKVKNSAYATIKPALRQTVLDTVRRVMARACCRLAPQA